MPTFYAIDRAVYHVNQDEQVLIFCPKKKAVTRLADLLCQYYKQRNHQLTKKLTEEREKICDLLTQASGGYKCMDGNVCLQELVQEGVGVHHANLTEMTKGLMERAFQDGTLNVLVSTSTLQEGVNLPCAVVIIVSTKTFSNSDQKMGCQEYLQKIGRAGRLEFNIDHPTSYLIVEDSDKDYQVQRRHAEKLIRRQIDFESFTAADDEKLKQSDHYLAKGGAFNRMLLCWIVASKDKNIRMDNLVNLVKKTFYHHLLGVVHKKERSKRVKRKLEECNDEKKKNENGDEKKKNENGDEKKTIGNDAIKNENGDEKAVHDVVVKNIWQAILFLGAEPNLGDNNKLVHIHCSKLKSKSHFHGDVFKDYTPRSWSLRATPLGRAVILSSLSIFESIKLFGWFSTKKFSMLSMLPLLACVVPVYSKKKLKKWPRFGQFSEPNNNLWTTMNNQVIKLNAVDRKALARLGYEQVRVEALLRYQARVGTLEELQKYERVLNTLILYDAINDRKQKRSRIWERWDWTEQNLNKAQRESVKMCGRVRTFCKETNFTCAHMLFGKAFKNKLRVPEDQEYRILKTIDISHQDAKYLQSEGYCTPNEIASANMKQIIAALVSGDLKNGGANLVNEDDVSQRAKQCQEKAQRHLRRLNGALEDDEEEEDEEEDEEEGDGEK